MKDPFYREIVERLAGKLDPHVFERCMGDLLRDEFPGIVPVEGGNDAGMDGAIPDGEGEPYPLICTTDKKVIRNLTNSLARLEAGDRRRKAVLATSQKLTPKRREHLFEKARDKGFFLLQIVEREGVADRLYRSSRWCMELLGLPGQPSALSAVPATRRRLIEIEPVGREADLDWLRTTAGDRLLIGEPGSGKTFLLHHLVREGWGLFLTSDDETAIANALLEQDPEVVIVDDAHAYPRRVDALRRLRDEIRAEFEIVATTWDNEKTEIVDALGGIPESKIRRLELLTRAEIKEVYERAGIATSEAVLREMIDQAANKPGLAMTLATLWLEGEWESLIRGEAITRTLLAFFEKWVGRDSAAILAAFALGGDAGMSMGEVAHFFEITPLEMRQKVVALKAGGVLHPEGNFLIVRPRIIRSVLLGSVFFRGDGTDLDFRPLLERTPDFARAVEALVLARAAGAEVRSRELEALMSQVPADDWRGHGIRAWKNFASLSEGTATWALKNYPGDLVDVADVALRRAPEETIPRLLDRAGSSQEPYEIHPEHPIRLIASWVASGLPDLDCWLDRHRLLLGILREYLQAGGSRDFALQCLVATLSPVFYSSEADALEEGITTRFGVLPAESLRSLEEIWAEGFEITSSRAAANWQRLTSLLSEWIHPAYPPRDDQRRAMKVVASRMVADLTEAVRESPGRALGLRRLAGMIDLDLQIESDELLDRLYPSSDSLLGLSGDERRARREAALEVLTRHWNAWSAEEGMSRLAHYEEEARYLTASEHWERLSPALCRRLAEAVDEPIRWLDEAVRVGLSSELVYPFLRHIVRARQAGFETRLDRLLDEDAYAWIAVELVLTSPEPREPLLCKALGKATHFTPQIRHVVARGEIPCPTMSRILRHRCQEVAVAAAVGEWESEPTGEVREELRADWRKVVLKAEPAKLGSFFETLLNRILLANPSLTQDRRRLHG